MPEPPKTASPRKPVQSDLPAFVCGTAEDYTFCAPQKTPGDYYLALTGDAASTPAADISRIQALLQGSRQLPEKVKSIPKGMTVPPQARVYRVNGLLPRFVVEKNGREDGLGPNCYQAALVLNGYEDAKGRYVDSSEFRYYLKRDFAPSSCDDLNAFGTVVVYDLPSSEYGAGHHAAIHLLGGVVFQKGDVQTYYPYEVALLDSAMKAVSSHWRPDPADRFGGPKRDPVANASFEKLCYRKVASPKTRTTKADHKDRSWHLPLFQYYIRRMEKAAALQASEFRQKRMDLLSVENMWKALEDFRERIGNYGADDVLLSIDDDIAQAYLKLHSLSWQYDTMTQAYSPLRDGIATIQLEALYRDHYATFDAAFHEELRFQMELRKVPKEKQGAVAEKVVAEIKVYDPATLAKHNKRVPYYSIIDEAIRQTP
ncbi:MAG: hypothetical protein V2A66_00955 [Pseudomonadota bacterium]